MDIALNIVEANVIREALRYRSKRLQARGMADSAIREEVYFIEGIWARLGGLIYEHKEVDLFCPKCGWYGNTKESRCFCGTELRLTRGGVTLREGSSAASL